jgi:hypothetical protein
MPISISGEGSFPWCLEKSSFAMPANVRRRALFLEVLAGARPWLAAAASRAEPGRAGRVERESAKGRILADPPGDQVSFRSLQPAHNPDLAHEFSGRKHEFGRSTSYGLKPRFLRNGFS